MGEEVMRCPCCQHISVVKVDGIECPSGMRTIDSDPYFACQNPRCNVERIYASNAVMVSGE
jgi:hypothetical protein